MNRITTIYVLHNRIGGKYSVEFLRSNGSTRSYDMNTFDHCKRVNKIDSLLLKHCAIYDTVKYATSTLTVYLPIRFPPQPVKTNPLVGMYTTSRAGVWYVEFIRKNSDNKSYKIMDWKRLHTLDVLLKMYCEVAEANLLSAGRVSIWYNMKRGK